MANTFYENTVRQHLQKLIEERDWYLENLKMSNLSGNSEETKNGYRLMAEFYDALIDEAEKHIANHT